MVITKGNVSEYTLTGEFDIAGTVSEDNDAKLAKDSKKFTLRVNMDGISLDEIVQGFLRSRKITWAANERKEMSFQDGAVIRIAARTGGSRGPRESGEEKLAREISGMSDEEAAAYLLAKVKAAKK